MKKYLVNAWLWMAGLALGVGAVGHASAKDTQPVYFMSDPSLSPDGKTIVFAYDDDLWTVPASGGVATRITGMQGRENNPRYSPDGKWIAFTGRQDGSANVYIMPTDGGEIKQLTFHEGVSTVESWSWDSKYVYFTGDAYNSMSSYKIGTDGGTPQRLFPHYFNWPHCLVEHPKTGEYYFTDSWESSRFTNRKRYKGEFNPDIKSWNPKTSEYKVHTTYNGKDMWPTIDRDGNIYYVSDQGNDEYNLYRLKNDVPEALTDFKTSIKQPQVNSAGDHIVFEKDYRLFLYDVASRKTEPVDIRLPEISTLELAENYTTRGHITAFDVSPDDKKLAFISRGELFVSDIEGKYVRRLPLEGEGRAMEVKWMADNKTLVFSKKVNGWDNWFKISAAEPGKEKQITFDNQSNRALVLSKKRNFGVYLSGRDELRRLNLDNFKSDVLLKDEFWGIENSTPQISPDGQYVAYTAKRNFEEDIFLYHFEDQKIINLTNTGVTETEPCWSPDGKYLYFTTDRVHPTYPYGFSDSKIYRIALDNYESDFKEDRYNHLFTKEEKADSLNASPYPIPDGVADRWEQITTATGNQSNAFAYGKKDEVKVFYLSELDGKTGPLGYWSKKPFAKGETKRADGDDMSGFDVATGKSKIMALSGGNIYELDADGAKLKKVDIDYSFSHRLSREFQEMFEETWANVDENYYDDKFHGQDWDKLRARYQAYMPYVRTRANLRTLLNDMLGELNSSHMGFYSFGDEEHIFYSTRTAETGVLYSDTDPYTVAAIVHRSPADKKGKDIKPGDVLYAVNGEVVDKTKNRDYYFTSAALPDEMELTFKRGGDTYSVRIHPESPAALKAQLYDAWIDDNQRLVDEKSGKRVAYIDMKDMGQGSLVNFETEMANEAYNRDALILDLRYNTGGNVHDFVLRYLSQKPYLNWKYRDGKLSPQPNFFPAGKPIVLLINEQTLSDGEMTSAGFQALNLGKIVGTETYRWIIFTSSKSMVDGSYCRMPSWGCYKLNGDDIEKTGVTPDIVVKCTLADRMQGKDPQLEKAIDVVMGELK